VQNGALPPNSSFCHLMCSKSVNFSPCPAFFRSLTKISKGASVRLCRAAKPAYSQNGRRLKMGRQIISRKISCPTALVPLTANRLTTGLTAGTCCSPGKCAVQHNFSIYKHSWETGVVVCPIILPRNQIQEHAVDNRPKYSRNIVATLI
jgi:hypothetical protein